VNRGLKPRPWPQAAPARPYFAPIDSNGNLTTKVEGGLTWTYVWDAENRLKWVCNTTPCTEAASVASFKYDPLGRRVEKIAGGVTTTYTHDGEDILREISGATTTKYVHGPGLIDEPLAQEDGGGALTYFHADGLGSVVKTTNSAAVVLMTRRYDAFGVLELGATNGYSFTGREWDGETGLYYYRARYYDPKIGRFISEDPLPVTLRGTEELNAYTYAANNPSNRRDPRGLLSGGVSDCDYYKGVCDAEKADGCGDAYACNAYECCRAFGEGEKQNCVRQCLIIENSDHCMALPAAARRGCRVQTHYFCYRTFKYLPRPWDVPLTCLRTAFGS
jgi:RHS repeat-associated protein